MLRLSPTEGAYENSKVGSQKQEKSEDKEL